MRLPVPKFSSLLNGNSIQQRANGGVRRGHMLGVLDRFDY